jgi:type F conjugative transfer system protein TrbI
MKRALEFFYKGPGVIIIIIATIVGVGAWMRHKQDEKAKVIEAKEAKHEMGTLDPKTNVEPAAPPKEVSLDKRELQPAFRSETAPPPRPQQSPIQNGVSVGLPTLVAFYTQVSEVPTPTPVPAPTPPPAPEVWCPPSRFIPCVLVNSVNSSTGMDTPVVGKVSHDVICLNPGSDGKDHRIIVVPAGTVVSSFANGGAVRDRIPVSGTWLFVFPDNRSMKVEGIACDREADPSTMQFGDEDGTPGLRGELVETNHWANLQAFLTMLMTTGNQAITAAASNAIPHGFGGGVVLPDTSAFQAKYMDQLWHGSSGDARYVHVSASTEFYIFPANSIMPRHRQIDNRASTKEEQAGLDAEPVSTDPAIAALQHEERQLEGIRQQQGPNQNEEQHPKYHY